MSSKVKEMRKKSFMDYAIWVDFPLNLAIVTFFVLKIRNALQMGIEAAVESDFGVATGSDTLDLLLIFTVPMMTFIVVLSIVTETIFIILKLRGKRPFITEKYSIIYIVGKLVFVFIIMMVALIF